MKLKMPVVIVPSPNYLLKRHWGSLLFAIVCISSLVKLIHTGQSGHYDIFRTSAIKIWHGEVPYGVSYPFGQFFYSPSCALFFYGAFAWMPYSIGLLAYMLTSVAIFVWGATALQRTLGLNAHNQNLFWALISSEAIGTILNARIELMMVGIAMAAGAMLARRRPQRWLAVFLLAMVCNFKMQEFPTVGLLLLVSAICDRSIKTALFFCGSLIFWYGIPYVIKPASFITENYHLWNVSLVPYLKASWPNYQHIFRFLSKSLGLNLSFGAAQFLSAATGILFAICLGYRTVKQQDHNFLHALGLGAGFVLIFSPMGQSAAFVLYAPLLIALAFNRQNGARFLSYIWTWIIAIGFFFVSISASDLVPKFARIFLTDHAVKPFGILWLTTALLIETVHANSAPAEYSKT